MPDDARSIPRSSAPGVTRWWWVVVAVALVGAGIGHFLLTPTFRSYRATTTLLVGVPLDAAFVHADDITTSEDLARVLVRMIPQQSVLEGVASGGSVDGGWQALRDRVSANVAGHSNRLIVVTTTAPTADEATAIAAAVPRALAAAAFPEASSPEAERTFLWSRIDAIRGHIVDTQGLITDLQRSAASDPADAAVARRLRAARSLLDRWEASLASIYRQLEAGTSADHLQVVEEPSVASSPFAAELRIDAAAAIVAAILALVVMAVIDRPPAPAQRPRGKVSRPLLRC